MNFSPTFSLRCSSRFTVFSELPSPLSSPFLFFNIEIPVRYSPGVPLTNANALTDPLGLLQATAVAYHGSLLVGNLYKADGFIKIDVCPSVMAPTFNAPKTLVFYPIASSLLGQLDPAIRYPDPAIISGLFTFGGGKTFAIFVAFNIIAKRHIGFHTRLCVPKEEYNNSVQEIYKGKFADAHKRRLFVAKDAPASALYFDFVVDLILDKLVYGRVDKVPDQVQLAKDIETFGEPYVERIKPLLGKKIRKFLIQIVADEINVKQA
ncbi:hypothetical protein H9P43_007709 [Blastocladiella emersonii ATCC 22665]|nr:hypothetical protein H9P43_007709 [Blastocladiella emersonii ATCC 22665]